MNIVDRIAGDLNDRDHIAWPVHDLTDWISEGVSLIVSLMPELFRKRKVYKVEPCTELQDVPCCDFIFSVLGQSTKEGRVIKPIRRSGNWLQAWPSVTACTTPRWSGLTRYSIESKKTLFLAPQVPAGEDVYVLLDCTSIEDVDPDNMPDDTGVALVQWVLYRARSMDSESSFVGDLGERNYTKMKELLGMIAPRRQRTTLAPET